MRTLVLVIVILALGYGAYRYWQDPSEGSRLVAEVTKEFHSIAGDTPSPAPPAKWMPPAIIPAQPNWTWTTTDGKVYHNVKIVRIDASCVTILHSEGGGRIPISSLSADMQKYFNYDPAAAALAERDFNAGLVNPLSVEGGQPSSHPRYYSVTTDYAAAVDEAKSEQKLLLLHFTGSDWCYYCQQMDEEVLSKPAFHDFSAENFVIVTLDFPRNSQLSAALQQQNQGLSQKYGVRGFPTLVVTDPDGHELGRTVGYHPGAGADSVINTLKSFPAR